MISGSSADDILLGVAGIAVAIVVLLAARARPKLGIAIALGTVAFIPVWIGVNIGPNGNIFLPVAAAAAVLAAAAFVPIRYVRLSPMDAIVAFLLIVTTASLFTGNPGIARTFLFALFLTGITGYFFGRVAPTRVSMHWIFGAIAVVFTIVAVLAIIEFITGWNPFIGIRAGNAEFAEWGGLQDRGGVTRVEGAFGHAIALGSSLALAIPLTYSSRFRIWIRAAMIATMLGAIVLTFSRTALICAVLGLLLSLLFLRDAASPRERLTMGITSAAAVLILSPLALSVFSEAGSEAENSAAYRGDLWSLFAHMNLVGLSDLVRKTSTGEVYFENFQSIDNQFVLTGISVGLIGLAVIAAALIVGIVLIVRGHATPATVAVIAHIPALATVALITQYSLFLWIVIGLAAAGQAELAHARHVYNSSPVAFTRGPRLRNQPERIVN